MNSRFQKTVYFILAGILSISAQTARAQQGQDGSEKQDDFAITDSRKPWQGQALKDQSGKSTVGIRGLTRGEQDELKVIRGNSIPEKEGYAIVGIAGVGTHREENKKNPDSDTKKTEQTALEIIPFRKCNPGKEKCGLVLVGGSAAYHESLRKKSKAQQNEKASGGILKSNHIPDKEETGLLSAFGDAKLQDSLRKTIKVRKNEKASESESK